MIRPFNPASPTISARSGKEIQDVYKRQTHASTFSETFTSVSTEQQTTQATDIVEQETEQTHASSENDEPMAPTPASVSVGNSTLKSTCLLYTSRCV